MYDSEAHSVASDHRSDNISAPRLKGQLPSALQKDLLPFLEHISAFRKPSDPHGQLHTLAAHHSYSQRHRLRQQSCSRFAQEHKGSASTRLTISFHIFIYSK